MTQWEKIRPIRRSPTIIQQDIRQLEERLATATTEKRQKQLKEWIESLKQELKERGYSYDVPREQTNKSNPGTLRQNGLGGFMGFRFGRDYERFPRMFSRGRFYRSRYL